MIKRLKRRFVFINMTILTCVLLSILVAVFALMYSSEVKLSYEFMESLMSERRIPKNEMLPDKTLNNNDESLILDIAPLSNTYEYENDEIFLTAHMDDWHLGNDEIQREPMHTDYYPDNNEDNLFKPDNNKTDHMFPPEIPKFTEPNFPKNEPLHTTSLPHSEPTATTYTKLTDSENVKQTSYKSVKTNKASKTIEKHTEEIFDEETINKPKVTKPVYSGTDTTTSYVSPEFTNPPFKNDNKLKTEPDPFMGKVKRSYVYVEFDNVDNIEKAIYQYCTSEDNDAVKSAVKEICNDNDESGKISIGNNKYRYIFRYNPVESSYSIVMLDRTLEINTINRLTFIFIIIASAGLLIIFLISIFLANWTIKPVEKAWIQQKEFIANASHELKTPLTVISTNTDVVLSNAEDTVENQKKWLNYIKNETFRMSKLVNNLLCIAKYDANRIETTYERLDLSNVVSSICLQYEPLAFENQKNLITDIDKSLYILGDEDKIKQVVNILMDNALKYSLTDGTIKVSLKKVKQSSVCMTVSNSSETISQEQLDKIFDRFYRVDSSRNRKTGGSGLGLNIAKTIIENHKGTISVINKDNITSFIVVF